MELEAVLTGAPGPLLTPALGQSEPQEFGGLRPALEAWANQLAMLRVRQDVEQSRLFRVFPLYCVCVCAPLCLCVSVFVCLFVYLCLTVCLCVCV